MRLALVVTTRGTANVAIVTGVTARLSLAPLLPLALVVGSGLGAVGSLGLVDAIKADLAPVSYTHLTLPTTPYV